jgi:glycosyltransferase involved in cell wall biosynthesis
MMPSQKIRLMQVTHDLAIGGLQKVVVNICRTIDREAFDVSVLCLRALGPFAADIERLGIPVVLLPQKARGTDYLSFVKVAGALREGRPDVIHTHNTQPFVDGTLAALLSGVGRVVHTDHGRQFPDKRRYMLAERLLSRAAFKVVGVSDDTSQQLVAWEKIDPAKVMTIPNGVDCRAPLTAAGKTEKRRELGLDGTGPVLGVVGRLSEEKGVAYLFRAMPKVLRERPNAVLVVAGDGPLDLELRALATELAIEGSVRFLGPRSDVAAILGVLDLYVLPSLREGLPLILLEAMAAGCPIVATEVGGVPSAVDHDTTGLLIPPKDPDALAAAIVSLLEDAGLRRKFSEAGSRLVRDRYSVEAMTRRYERLYREAAGTSRS